MFTFKKYVFIITLYFLTTLLYFSFLFAKESISDQQKTESKQAQVSIENHPQISIDPDNKDVGEVWEGEEIVCIFNVKNTGTTQLNIKNVKAG